jgi:hypothetical protein
MLKSILEPASAYRIQPWGTASTFDMENLEHFQTKVLRVIVDATLYVPSAVIRRDLQTPTVTEEIRHYRFKYNARLSEPHGATRQQAIAKTPAK